MNFNITIGQYYPTNSIIHRLDPRVKFLATLNIIVVLFFTLNPLANVMVITFIGFVIFLSKIPIKPIIRGLRALMYVILFTVFLNLFFAPGEQVIFKMGFVTITLEAVLWSVQMALRLIMLIITSSMLTLTTPPVALTNAMESLMAPMKKIKFPVHEIAMMMTIALRFIPTLLEEADKITKAQMARGASFDTGNAIKRAKSLIPILVPLFVSAFRRADDLAMAMEARCYRGDMNRTRMKDLKYETKDAIAFLFCLMLTVGVIFTKIL